MSMLFKIVYAAHANGTHHKLALDALNRLASPDAENWRRLFLKHAELYLEGSKAPDKEFKDFKNHVLHPGDKYWGGAPEKARNWYTHLVTALRDKQWSEAAYAAGVLSHYYTDPVMPFHTAQSEAENSMHRAVEWSINRTYNSLFAEAQKGRREPSIVLPDSETWIEEFVCASADHSNTFYGKLIAHYDLEAGAVKPETGLDKISRAFIGGLLVRAAAGYALILDRAIAESGVTPEKVTLTAQTLIATLKIPSKWVLKKLDDAEDRRVVAAMFDELQTTGRVDKTLPEDDRVVRDLHEREVAAPERKARRKEQTERLDRTRKAERKPTPTNSTKPNTLSASPSPQAISEARRQIASQAAALAELASSEKSRPAPQALPEIPATATAARTETAEKRAPNIEPIADNTSAATNRSPRVYLSKQDDIVDAPSIGERTAGRLASAGILTVADLLRADPDEVAETVDYRHIDAKTIRLWQEQARLVMEIPGLRGTHAQLLAGAGYRTAQAVAEADAAELSAAILRFASTNDGQRLLRDGAAPDIEKIRSWIEQADLALKAA